MSKEFEHLFTPFNIGKLTVKNRFAVSAMYLYEAGARGEFTNSAINYYVERAKGGFDGIEVHAMHWGYLLDQFAMSITNHRTDEYGGSLENRLRASREILDGVKAECGSDYPVIMKMGLKSYMTGLGYGQGSLDGEDEKGRTLEESIEIAKLLESYGYDGITCNVGNYESMFYACAPMYVNKGFVLPFSTEVKKHVNIPILVAGRMNDPYQSEKAIPQRVAVRVENIHCVGYIFAYHLYENGLVFGHSRVTSFSFPF